MLRIAKVESEKTGGEMLRNVKVEYGSTMLTIANVAGSCKNRSSILPKKT